MTQRKRAARVSLPCLIKALVPSQGSQLPVNEPEKLGIKFPTQELLRDPFKPLHEQLHEAGLGEVSAPTPRAVELAGPGDAALFSFRDNPQERPEPSASMLTSPLGPQN